MQIRIAQKRDSAAMAKVQVDTWRTTYDGAIPHDYLTSLSDEQHEIRWRKFFAQKKHMQIAYLAETPSREVTGFASGGLNHDVNSNYQGELYNIYILEKHQHSGIGRQLVAAVARYLLEHEIVSMIVWVLGNNPSRKFYESLGGQYVTEKNIIIGGAALQDVAYGWRDLRVLIKGGK